MTVKLNANDRLAILFNLLPRTGSLTDAKLIKSIHDLISLEDDELATIDYLEDRKSGGAKWSNVLADKLTGEYDFTDLQVTMISNHLRKIEGEGKLDYRWLEMYGQFCERDKDKPADTETKDE